MGAVLSFGQDARWRRFMVSKVNAIPGSWALDVASGTGLVSRELAARKDVRVAALDQSEQMLRTGREPTRLAGLEGQVAPVLGEAERLPFRKETFDSVTFTYLLRYVDDPQATLIRCWAPSCRPHGGAPGRSWGRTSSRSGDARRCRSRCACGSRRASVTSERG